MDNIMSAVHYTITPTKVYSVSDLTCAVKIMFSFAPFYLNPSDLTHVR